VEEEGCLSEQIGYDVVTGPLGTFSISTIRTFSGGGGSNRLAAMPFLEEADYANETPWPFETLIWRGGGGPGLYHAPYATKDEARKGHALMIETVKLGTEFGGGVQGPFGNPSTTPEQWKARMQAQEQSA
jgi:hypothetical protein